MDPCRSCLLDATIAYRESGSISHICLAQLPACPTRARRCTEIRKISKMNEIPIIKRRQIEARILGHVYQVIQGKAGEAVARSIVTEAISKAAVEHGKELAQEQGGERNLQDFADLLPLWNTENVLEIEMIKSTQDRLEFNVVRCGYHEMYEEMGLAHIGDLISCNRDGTFCAGYNPDIELDRTQTIMEGASHCDFRFSLKSNRDE